MQYIKQVKSFMELMSSVGGWRLFCTMNFNGELKPARQALTILMRGVSPRATCLCATLGIIFNRLRNTKEGGYQLGLYVFFYHNTSTSLQGFL